MAGGPTPDDPEGVPSDSLVYRRIPPQWYLADDDRPSSAAFGDLPGAMSVGLGVVVAELGHDPLVVIEAHPAYGLVALSVTFLREQGLGVLRDPTGSEPWHGNVHGPKTKGA